MIFLITYDLNAEGKDYNALYDRIKSLGEWFHPLESAWFLHTSGLSEDDIATKLREVMDDSKDQILVVEIAKQPRQGWLPKTAWEWLKEHE